MAIGRHQFRLLEAKGFEIAAKHLGHFEDSVVLRRDGWLPQPALDGGDVVEFVGVDEVVHCLVLSGVGFDRRKVVGGVGR